MVGDGGDLAVLIHCNSHAARDSQGYVVHYQLCFPALASWRPKHQPVGTVSLHAILPNSWSAGTSRAGLQKSSGELAWELSSDPSPPGSSTPTQCNSYGQTRSRVRGSYPLAGCLAVAAHTHVPPADTSPVSRSDIADWVSVIVFLSSSFSCLRTSNDCSLAFAVMPTRGRTADAYSRLRLRSPQCLSNGCDSWASGPSCCSINAVGVVACLEKA